jgi:hypothetical protein
LLSKERLNSNPVQEKKRKERREDKRKGELSFPYSHPPEAISAAYHCLHLPLEAFCIFRKIYNVLFSYTNG